MFGQRDRWAAFQELYTLSSPHTLLYIHKLFYFLCNAFCGTYPVGLYFVQYQEEGALLQYVALNSIVLLRPEELVSDAFNVHLVTLHLNCVHCTASKLHWRNVLTFNCM